MKMEELKRDLRQVLSGEIEASDIGIESDTIQFKVLTDVSLRTLRFEHYRFSNLAASARHLGLPLVEQALVQNLEYIAVLAKKFHNVNLQPCLVSAQDIAETSLAFIGMLETAFPSTERTSGNSNKEDSEHDNEVEVVRPMSQERTSSSADTQHVQEVGQAGTAQSTESERNHVVIQEEVSQEEPEVITRPKKASDKTAENERDVVIQEEISEEEPEVITRPKKASDKTDKNGKKNQEKEKKESKKSKGKKDEENESEEKRFHYSKRPCPLCNKKVCNMVRHLRNIHVVKNECIPEARIKALLQMSRHGNKTSIKYKKDLGEGKSKVYQRQKDICFMCDSVVLYLSKHVWQVHGLEKNSNEYMRAMIMSRKYNGSSKELQWDLQMIERKRKSTECMPSTSSKRAKWEEPRNRGLQLLAEELGSASSSSDEDFNPNPNVIPPSPGKQRSSLLKTNTQEKNTHDHPDDDDDSSSDDSSSHSERSVQSDEGQQAEEGEQHQADYQDDELQETSSKDGSDDSDSEYDDELDDETDEETFNTWSEYYKEAEGGTLMEKLLILYYQHLQDILGGCKKERHAIEHAQNVRRIRDAINKQDDTLDALLEDGGLNVWRLWAKPLLDSKKVRPGTIRASLTSPNKFLKFIIDQVENKVKSFPRINAQTIEKTKRMIKRVVAMGSSINQLYAHENWERVLEDQMNAVNPEDTCKMIDTDGYSFTYESSDNQSFQKRILCHPGFSHCQNWSGKWSKAWTP